MLFKMAKPSILLRTVQQSFKLHLSNKLPLLSCISYQPRSIQISVPIYEVNKRSYSSKNVANLERIYTGPAARNIFLLKILSLTTSATAVVLEVSLFLTKASVAIKFGWSLPCLFTFSTPFFAHIILRKYVIQMYYDATNDSYTAVMYTLFATKKYINFTINDIKQLDIEIFSTVRIKGKPMFFDPQHFTDVHHYKRLLGYDKPLKLDTDNLQNDLENLRKSREEAANKTNKA